MILVGYFQRDPIEPLLFDLVAKFFKGGRTWLFVEIIEKTRTVQEEIIRRNKEREQRDHGNRSTSYLPPGAGRNPEGDSALGFPDAPPANGKRPPPQHHLLSLSPTLSFSISHNIDFSLVL